MLDTIIENAVQLFNNAHPGKPSISEKEFGIYYHNIKNLQFDPSNGVMNDIISSGKLSLIQNDTIKTYIASWDGTLKTIQLKEKILYDDIEQFQKLINEFGNGHVTGYYGRNEKIPKSKFDKSNLPLLKMVQFETYLSEVLGNGYELRINFYTPLKEELVNLISIIDSELKK